MRYCSKCGSANPDDMAYCPRCGTSMEYAPYAPQPAAAPAAQLSPSEASPAEVPAEAVPAITAPAGLAAAPIAPAAPAPVAPVPQPQATNVSAVWMILNITATVICCPGFFLTVPGIIFGALGSESFKKGDRKDAGSKATLAMVFFILGLLVGLAGWIGVLALVMRRYYNL